MPASSIESASGLVVDIGGTKLLVGAVRQGVIVRRRALPVSQFAGPAGIMDAVATTGRQLCASAGLTPDSAVVAVAGRLDRDTGSVRQAANLPLVDFPLAAELSARLGGIPVRIEHDAVCGLLGETVLGAARGCASVIYLTVSTGISVGILIDGGLLEGAHGAAGELGHTPVEVPGIPCPCGSSGCLEAYASGRALADLGQQAAASGASPALAGLTPGGPVTARDVLAAARAGDGASAAIVDHAIGLLTRSIRLLVTTLDPELVVLGGGVMSNAYFAGRVRAGLAPAGGNAARVRRAQLGARSVLYGGMLFLGQRRGTKHSGSNGSARAPGAAGKGAFKAFTTSSPGDPPGPGAPARPPA